MHFAHSQGLGSGEGRHSLRTSYAILPTLPERRQQYALCTCLEERAYSYRTFHPISRKSSHCTCTGAVIRERRTLLKYSNHILREDTNALSTCSGAMNRARRISCRTFLWHPLRGGRTMHSAHAQRKGDILTVPISLCQKAGDNALFTCPGAMGKILLQDSSLPPPEGRQQRALPMLRGYDRGRKTVSQDFSNSVRREAASCNSAHAQTNTLTVPARST